MHQLDLSNFVIIVVTVPETYADQVRAAMGKAGAGKLGNYSHCSFSVKGVGRFMPNSEADPFIGEKGVLETVVEERIETVCSKDCLEEVIDAIRKAHPYEEPAIDLCPTYQLTSRIC